MPKYLPYLTTQRCRRQACGLTVRLIAPIEHCPRCDAAMETVETPRRDFEALIATATSDVILGFETLLSTYEPQVDFRIRVNRCADCR